MNSFLRERAWEGFHDRYGRAAPDMQTRARRQIERELTLIEKLKLAGYFLIVWDLVRFCREQNILVQGRGSAANSAVCYSLGITAVDAVGMELLFERFLSEERGEWPDIDLDLPSGDEREKVIQYLYQRYGERGAAMTANVITYRNRMAAREMGKALGFDPETLAQNFRRRRHLGISRRERRPRPPLPRRRTRPQPSPPAQILRTLPRRAGHAAPSRPALRRHGHLPGTTRFRRPARTRVHARPRRRAVGQRRLRRHGHHQSRSARPRHDGRAQGFHRTHSRSLSRRSRPRASSAGRSAGVLRAAAGRHHRPVSGGKPRANVVPAAPAPQTFLRHRGAGRDHPPRPDRRPDGESIFAAPPGTRRRHLSASLARTRAEAHARRSALSGTTAAHWP